MMGKHKFLLIKNIDQKTTILSGSLTLYSIRNDVLILYTPTFETRKIPRAIKRKLKEPETSTKPSPQEKLVFSKLDESTVRYLTRLADDKKQWQEIPFVRMKDLTKAKENIQNRSRKKAE